ncbi:MAG: HD domain-containing protein, partial [Calditrichaeota bacterium]|nr:HD domain-containing protein [Calditrichota bacterium]
ATGRIEAQYWDNFREFHETAKVGQVVKVQGTIAHWQGIARLQVQKARVATPEDGAPEPRDFLPHSERSPEEMRSELRQIIASLSEGPLKELLRNIFEDEEIWKPFAEAPGGKLWHHAYLGGLAEHTLSLAHLCDLLAGFYKTLNRDLLIAGALLHDVGKISELDIETGFDYSIEGRLLGHITLGALFVEERIKQIEGFPEETRRQLLHLILSHQGEGAMGSPVKPMMLEALALHYADDLDSKFNALERIRAQTPEDQPFSDYIKLMERFFYFGADGTETDLSNSSTGEENAKL